MSKPITLKARTLRLCDAAAIQSGFYDMEASSPAKLAGTSVRACGGFAIALLGLLSLDCWATTYYVKPDGDDSKDGTSWATALKTPNKGFDKINGTQDNHEVVIAAGTYTLTEPCRCSGPYAEGGKRVVFRGETGNPADVVIKGNGTFEIIRLARCVTVAGLTISNGSNSGRENYAAGVRVGASETGVSIVSNCIITACNNAYTSSKKGTDNKIMYGGPVYVLKNGLIVDSVVSNNTSIYYGCGVTLDGPNATALRCRIESNVATNGEDSGVAVLGVNGANDNGGRMIDCVVQSNLTSYCAGARTVSWVEGCTFRGNALDPNKANAHSSSAMAIVAPDVVVTNCTFADNRADAGYATVSITQPRVNIIDSRFVGNSVGNYGGAIYFCIGASSGFSAISNCLFAGNSVSQSSSKGGGAIRIEAGNVDVANCTFSNNTAYCGGAVDMMWSERIGGNPNTTTRTYMSFTNCLFVGNTSKEFGGAVRVALGAQALLNDCRIVGNETTYQSYDYDQGGGGVFLYQQQSGGWCVASNSVFASNVSKLRGGGWGHSWNGYAFGKIVNCIFTNNVSALNGGGLAIREDDSHRHDRPFLVRNSLFAFNRTTQAGDNIQPTSDANGGGVYFVSCNDVVLDSCTIVSNDSGYSMSGGVHHRWGGTITNCVIAFNTVKGQPEPTSADAWSMDASCYQHCCIYPAVIDKFLAANGCVNADPRFVDLANGEFDLRSGSPCRDAGIVEDWMTGACDIVGNPRVYGKGVDMGCYERNNFPGVMVIVF